MSFTTASPSIVRSVVQRNMLNTWLHLFGRDHTLPNFDEYRFERLGDERVDLAHYDVQRRDSGPRFRVGYMGQRLLQAFGEVSIGDDLETFIGAELGPTIMPAFFACISKSRPIYSVLKMADADGKPVTYERMLLPFGSGLHVDFIFGSFKTISEEGTFKQNGLLRHSEKPTHLIQAVIDHGLALNRIARQMDADIIEI